MTETVTQKDVNNALWRNSPTRPDSATWLPGMEAHWIEWRVIDNVVEQIEHRLEVVGCRCGWERMCWPDESTMILDAHMAKHRTVQAAMLISRLGIEAELIAERVVDIVNEYAFTQVES